MTTIRLRDGEAAAPDPFLLWDTRWNTATGEGDWALAGFGAPANAGGLAATRAIETAVILCLMTDRRVPEGHPLAWLADGDRRGWWGDFLPSEQDGEAELGSLLWLLERAPLTGETARWAESLAVDALQPILAQGAAVRAVATAQADPLRNRLDLLVELYGRDGQRVWSHRFDDLWRQVSA